METFKPLVSIIIPCHQKGSTIARAIESVKKQTLNNLECFVVLDNCSDNSLDEIKKAIEGDYRFSYKEVHFGNVADTRNYGANLAQGLFLCFLDGDDYIDDTFLEVCTKPLLENRLLGCTYTGLTWHKPDGTTGLSEWPEEWNFDRQLQGSNQIPTCSVIRKEAWERLGGQRARYCGIGGCGTEDAEFYLRLGAYGWKAKKVSNEGLFHYSWMSGLVTGNPDYKEINWRSMHPWILDGKHPFASYASPAKYSHTVSQYDQPLISVVIPVGSGHEKEVENALDSLEMQTFRKWEVVLVDDTGQITTKNDPQAGKLAKAYPYVRFIHTNRVGAGKARNIGVRNARASLIFFLDADDVLASPDTLQKMYDAWNQQEAIIYSDYLGKAQWNLEEAQKEFGERLLAYNTKQNTAVFKKRALDFNPELAQRQPEYSGKPNDPYYHWCLVSVLVPKLWHLEIGGFDESLETWEDVDYHWRMARAGHCYFRIEDELVMYAYHKGSRREKSAVKDETSLQQHKSMIQYITKKYEKLELKMCNCGKKKQPVVQNGAMASGMSDSDLVMIEFHFPGDDTRTDYGKSLVSPTGQTDGNGRKLDYHGYARRKGDKFLVHKKDQQSRPDMFRLFSETVILEVPKQELPEPTLLPEPELFNNVVEAIEAPKKRGRKAKVSD